MSFLSHELGQPSPRRTHAVEGQEPLSFESDICERKHHGNVNSKEAHAKNVASGAYSHQVHEIDHILRHLRRATPKEIALVMRVDHNKISGRFISMRGEGPQPIIPPLIALTGDRRKGSAEYRSLAPSCPCSKSISFVLSSVEVQ